MRATMLGPEELSGGHSLARGRWRGRDGFYRLGASVVFENPWWQESKARTAKSLRCGLFRRGSRSAVDALELAPCARVRGHDRTFATEDRGRVRAAGTEGGRAQVRHERSAVIPIHVQATVVLARR